MLIIEAINANYPIFVYSIPIPIIEKNSRWSNTLYPIKDIQ